MSGNLGRTLYSSIWETASPLFVRGLKTSRFVYFETTNTSFYSSRFLSKTTARRISSLPRKRAHLTKTLASGGFFALGVSPASTLIENGTIAPAKVIPQCRYHRNRPASFNLLLNTWKRDLHTNDDSPQRTETSKNSSKSTIDRASVERDQPNTYIRPETPKPEKPAQELQQWGISNRQLFNRLPHVSQLHRPTKEELLAAATGFWSRLKIRFKWFSIRSVRPFNLDEITALFSWVLLGHVVWVVLGTTTFFSLLILAINTVLAQGKIIKIHQILQYTRVPNQTLQKL